MPRQTLPLNDTQIRSAKPKDKPYKLFDGGGLFLLISPSGGKLWNLKYRYEGHERKISLGAFPALSLAEARRKRDEIKARMAHGIDPAVARKTEKVSQSGEGSFEYVAREWHKKFSPTWSASHGTKLFRRLELYVFPWVGSRPVGEITGPELLNSVLRRIEERGHRETAHRALQICGQVFRYAVQTGRAERDPSVDLRGAIPPPNAKHFASITDPEKIGLLMQAIRNYSGSFITRSAMMLATLVFLRPGEVRKAEWSEFNIENAEWRIPIARMKRTKKEKDANITEVHIVPLARQAIAILQELYPLSGRGRFLFPGLRSQDRPISDATLINALRRMGYTGEEMTVHGFRHMASTLLHELGFPSHLIEKQLSHADRNRIRAVYNYAEYLPDRRKMMQAWADYLDKLAAGEGKKIIPFRSAGR